MTEEEKDLRCRELAEEIYGLGRSVIINCEVQDGTVITKCNRGSYIAGITVIGGFITSDKSLSKMTDDPDKIIKFPNSEPGQTTYHVEYENGEMVIK